MTTKTISIAMDEDELREARACAERDGLSLSAWLTRAARAKRAHDNGRRYRAAVEARTGEDREQSEAWEAATVARMSTLDPA